MLEISLLYDPILRRLDFLILWFLIELKLITCANYIN